MINPLSYLKENDLWDLECLKKHAQYNFVYVIESPRFPGIVMLHYQDECQYNNIWSTLSRLSRGLILDMENRKVLAWPFNKFFSLGQLPETQYELLKALGSFETSEKIDGSLCILYKVPSTGEFRLTTKGSLISEHGEYATSLLPEHLKKDALVEDFTLMFELISKKFQIVVDYSKKPGYVSDGLYLIGARKRVSGQLCSYSEVKMLAQHLNLPTFKTYSFDSLDQLIEVAKDLPVLEEGFVLRFPGDLLVKVKGNAYLQMHRWISTLSEGSLLDCIEEGKDSLFIQTCPDEFQSDIVNKIQEFKNKCAKFEKICYTYYGEAIKDSRKNFALWVQQHVEKYLQPFMFKLFDGKIVQRKDFCSVIRLVDKVQYKTKI